MALVLLLVLLLGRLVGVSVRLLLLLHPLCDARGGHLVVSVLVVFIAVVVFVVSFLGKNLL